MFQLAYAEAIQADREREIAELNRQQRLLKAEPLDEARAGDEPRLSTAADGGHGASALNGRGLTQGAAK